MNTTKTNKAHQGGTTMILPTEYQTFIALSRYARYRDEWNRRELWPETVKRYFDFFEEHLTDNFSEEAVNAYKRKRPELEEAVLNLEVMPSMRCMMTAGPALKAHQVGAYNCSFLAVNNPRAFDEAMYILMCGTGVGFSVERQHINQLPEIPDELHITNTTITVEDSKIGWASAYSELISLLYAGKIPKWDVSKVRPAGARLKTFGGRASGPEPLVDLFNFTVATFKNAAGRKLNSIECHDIMCKIGEVIVVGGVRRSALISLSNLTDERMRNAKNGAWWETSPHRMLANNSACYTEKPDIEIFMREWLALVQSKSGERGIYNLEGARAHAKAYGREKPELIMGTNPCGEILLRDGQFCNLSEAVIREKDKEEDLLRKVELAAILGTLQSTLTKFKYLSKKWKKNTEEERLLGVSLTGIMDNQLTSTNNARLRELLQNLRTKAKETNKKWAEKLDIPVSQAVTCVKPSGTVSLLVDSSSGIHPRFAPYYIRTIRNDKKDPLTQFVASKGIPAEDAIGNPNATVFSFPSKAPKNAVFVSDVEALDQLELWLTYSQEWCDHNPSITVYVAEDEWLDVAAWVYRNFKEVRGIAFLPKGDGHIYKQAPYQEITKEQYEELIKTFPTGIDWSELSKLELEDHTTGTKELACMAGVCEIG